MSSQGIAVVRPLYLGDVLCAVPALRALRRAAPGVPITLIGLPWAHAFARRFSHYLDGFVPFPGWPGIPEREPSRARLCEFYAQHRGRPYDLVLQMHGDGRVMNDFAASIPARVYAGFAPGAEACRSPLDVAYPTHTSERLRLTSLLEHLGIPVDDVTMEFPLTEADRREAHMALRHTEVSGDYVVLHPGSRSPDRRWSPVHFAAIADALAEECTVVLTGTEAEREVVQAVRERMHWPAVDLTGATSLGGVAAVVDGARLLVSNDTGVAHLADALGTPSAVVFTGSDPARWAPQDHERHRVLGVGNGGPHPAAGEVLEAARDLLRRAA